MLRSLRTGRHGGTQNQVMNGVVHDKRGSVNNKEGVLLETYL